MKALILSPWTGDGLTPETARRPLLAIDFPGLSWTDVTGQDGRDLPPDPNLLAVLVTCSPEQLAALEVSQYRDGILWVESET